MGGVTLVLKYRNDNSDCVAFEKPEKQFQEKINHILQLCDKKGGYVSVSIEPPYRPRTTGDKSQNNLFWLLATRISQETGMDIREVERSLKEKAINKGYPYHINKITGKPEGDSMTKINTVQMSYLIDTTYEVIAFLGIVLPPQEARVTLEHETNTGAEIVNETKSVVNLATESLYATEKMNPDEMEIIY